MDTLLDRFCRYVQVDTTAVLDTDRYPSSPGQLELGRALVEELRSLGIEDAGQDEHGIVMGTVPGNVANAPTIAWLAHLDTSPEAAGKDVRPIIHRNYDGNDIVLPGDPSKIIRVSETPGLAALTGKTLVTSDGTTLLGADDKAGVAVIMTAVAELQRDHSIEHGPIRVVFTTDEEVARGTDNVDVDKIAATCAYTLDGEGEGEIENETFSAARATVTIRGINIHPGLAYGKMINAVRLAGEFLGRLPADLAPETTTGRDGFLHPDIITGDVTEVRITLLLRSFDTTELERQAQLLRDAAREVAARHPRAAVEVEIAEQYRNMSAGLAKCPLATELAAEALRDVGIEPQYKSLRGGTDGSRLTELGLPTPNLATGMHNYHSPLEYACLEQMETACRALLRLAERWSRVEAGAI